MGLNDTVIQTKWPEIKGEVQKLWRKIMNDDLEKTRGDINEIGILVQKIHGDSTESSGKRLSSIFDRFKASKTDKMPEAGSNRKKNDDIAYLRMQSEEVFGMRNNEGETESRIY